MPLEQKYLDLIQTAVPQIEDPSLEKLALLYDRVLETNRQINITSLLSPIDVTLKHFIDSLTLMTLPEWNSLTEGNSSACDIGCGGGFPGLPLACCDRNLPLTMIDSTAKKITALAENAKLLSLDNVDPVCGRGEELASSKNGAYREKFDLCVSRAVAGLPILCELCLPFVKVGGTFLAMKGMKAKEEVADSFRAIPMLGGKLLDVREIKLDFSAAESMDFSEEEKEKIREFSSASRYVVIIEKKKKTLDIYPRKWAQMTKKSL